MTMKTRVSEFMVRKPASCTPEMNLGSAVEILWKRNCGILPVVDPENHVIGVITDRDICIALGTRNKLPGEIRVAELASKPVYFCKPADEIKYALTTMGQQKVRRLPVVDREGKLLGVLSMDDIVLHARAERLVEFSSEEIMKTLEAIYGRKLPVTMVRGTATIH
jgi:CBS domain-containing protein